MVIASQGKPIAEKQFVIPAAPERVWDLLGGAIFYCLPLENIDLQSETSFQAVLRWKMAFVRLSFDITGELLNASPPHLLDCIIRMRSKWGLVRQTMKVTFILKPVDSDRTEVVCRAANDRPSVFTWLMLGMQRSMAETTLGAIKARLEQLA